MKIDDTIHETREQKDRLDQQTRQIRDERQEWQNKEKPLSRRQDDVKKKMQSLAVRVNRLENEIKGIDEIREEAVGDLGEIEDSLKRLEEEKSEIEGKIEKHSAEGKEVFEASHPVEKELDAKKNEMEQMSESSNDSQQELLRIQTILRANQTKISKFEKLKTDYTSKKERFTKEHETLTAETAERRSKAESYCPEIPNINVEPHKIANEIERLERRIGQEKRGRQTKVVTEQYKTAQEKFNQVFSQLSSATSTQRTT